MAACKTPTTYVAYASVRMFVLHPLVDSGVPKS